LGGEDTTGALKETLLANAGGNHDLLRRCVSLAPSERGAEVSGMPGARESLDFVCKNIQVRDDFVQQMQRLVRKYQRQHNVFDS